MQYPGGWSRPVGSALAGTLWILVSAAALAQDFPTGEPPPAGAELPAACRPGTWDLTGADWRVREETSFNVAWIPTLEDVAACLAHPRMQRACVEVEGRFDERRFTLDVVRAFGSQRGAQEARARARSSRIISELLENGVSSLQIRELPPPRESHYRGARLSLEMGCLEAPLTPADSVSAEELERAVDDAVQSAVSEVVTGAVKSYVDQKQVPLESGPSTAQHLWIDGTLSLSFLANEVDAVFAPVLLVGLGWSNEVIYLHADVGLDVGTAEEQRLGFELSGAVGYVFETWSWLSVGLVGGNRFSAHSPDTPWLEQAWFLGLESAQCLWSVWPGGDLCLQETLVPAGIWSRWGRVEADGVKRIETSRAPYFRADFSVVLRHDFLFEVDGE